MKDPRYIELRRPFPVVYDLREWVLCHNCDRPLRRRWYHRFRRPLCGPEAAQVRRCAEIAAAWRSEPPAMTPDGSLDFDYEERPADIDVCPRCEGWGEVHVRTDWQTGAAETGKCPECGGSGQVRGEVVSWTTLPLT